MTNRNRGQQLTFASDGLPALSVAEHAKDKEFTIRNIAGIFTAAMHKKWPDRLYYVDLFSGPGKCVIRNSREETEGSPLIAAKVPFTNYFFADEDSDCINTLRRRIERLDLNGKKFSYHVGKADEIVDEILKKLPPQRQSLGLAFLDPWGWDYSFASLEKLTRGRRLDLLINFNIGHMKRNWRGPSSTLDSFLNIPSAHEEFFRASGVPDSRTLLDHYEEQLKLTGYDHIADDRPVTNSNNTPLYHIIFGSKHPLGKQLRDEVSHKTASGQIKMFD